ncbi:hypothetical protein ACH5RR_014922 [Cinchona calisaya]|uniref:Sulfite exporter TauE/SafE family protein n=1 Tax=Cinchona calisaya TaxID=153742 RepID=A0ABD2ZS37_9GENT
MKMLGNLKLIHFLLIFLITMNFIHAKEAQPIVEKLDKYVKTAVEWRTQLQAQSGQKSELKPTAPIVVAGALSFVAASISSAGGIGGGGLFIPILTIVAGFDLKTASSFTAFMVTGVTIANVAFNVLIKSRRNGGKTMIDYDIALLSEPCMLVGVSIGVIFNIMLPDWLITIIFAVFLAWSTFKTFKSGISYWKRESEGIRRNGSHNLENGMARNEISSDRSEETVQSLEEPLLHKETSNKLDLPWMKLGVLVLIWFSFFIIYVLHGDPFEQGIIPVEACGVTYWLISLTQIPLAAIFSSLIFYIRQRNQNQELRDDITNPGPNMFIFPLMALLAGVLGGVFGIGGGMLISPLLLQIGLAPEVTAATCSFMVLFASTMSSMQFLLLGMNHVYGAIIFAIICFIASVIGMGIVQKVIKKFGRSSLIVFSVGTVMTLSTILITSFGAVDAWRDYNNGKFMGFKPPC